MATQTFYHPQYIGTTDGSPRYIVGDSVSTTAGVGTQFWFREAASQTYAVNDLVYLDTSGNIAICTTTSNKLNSAILGQALRAASGTTSTPTYVAAIRPQDLFVMNVYHATPASSVTAQAQLQDVFGIINVAGTSSKWAVDIQNTTTEDGSNALAKVRVVGFPQGTFNGALQTIGDTNGMVIVQFVPFTIKTDGSGIVRNLQIV